MSNELSPTENSEIRAFSCRSNQEHLFGSIEVSSLDGRNRRKSFIIDCPDMKDMPLEPSKSRFEENFVNVRGIKTHYWETGEENEIPLILIHGGGAGADSWGNWKYALPQLEEKGFHVFAMDMVGFGKSGTPDPVSFDYTNQSRIDQLRGFIQELDLDRPSLVGNSMGGAASMGVAMQTPDIIDRLILAGAAGYLRPEERPPESQEAIDTLSAFDGTREAMFDIVDVLSEQDWYDRDAMVDHRIQNLERPGIQEALGETMRIVRTGDMFYGDDEIASIEHETLIINGRNDLVIPPEGAFGLFELINDSTVHVLNDCGHWVMVDQADWATSLIKDFFDEAN